MKLIKLTLLLFLLAACGKKKCHNGVVYMEVDGVFITSNFYAGKPCLEGAKDRKQ